MSTHYSKAQDTAELAKWAKKDAARLIRHYANREVRPLLVYSGFSGVAAATALSLALYDHSPKLRFSMAYVRKDGEQAASHSVCTIEHNIPKSSTIFEGVFVDDFQATGKTLSYCMEQLKLHRHASRIIWHDEAPLCLQKATRERCFADACQWGV